MTLFVHTLSLRAVIALAMALSVLLAPTGLSRSHDLASRAAAEAQRHAALSQQIDEHGHIHEDGTGDEHQSGHNHAHDLTLITSDHPVCLLPTVPMPPGTRLGYGLDKTAVIFPLTKEAVLIGEFKRTPDTEVLAEKEVAYLNRCIIEACEKRVYAPDDAFKYVSSGKVLRSGRELESDQSLITRWDER